VGIIDRDHLQRGQSKVIKFKVFEVMAQKGFRTRRALAEKAGMNATNLGRLIKGGQARIDVSTLSALCQALECQPGDLLEYVARKETALAGTG
jgi:putative transcriptional regulator